MLPALRSAMLRPTFAAFFVLPPPAANSSRCRPSSLSLITSANLRQSSGAASGTDQAMLVAPRVLYSATWSMCGSQAQALLLVEERLWHAWMAPADQLCRPKGEHLLLHADIMTAEAACTMHCAACAPPLTAAGMRMVLRWHRTAAALVPSAWLS